MDELPDSEFELPTHGSTRLTYVYADFSFYAYEPSHVLPIVFACIIGLSVGTHVWQNLYVATITTSELFTYRCLNSHYAYWHITFFMFYGGTIFTTGWILRAISTYYQRNFGLYVSQLVFTLAGPPIYAAAEYNILGRLMHYLPQHALLNPCRVLVFYILLGVLVENLTGIGAGQVAGGEPGGSKYTLGGTLMGIALVLQALVEVSFMILTGILHYRAKVSNTASKNVTTVCYMLYGTSTLILFRCIFRAVDTFTEYLSPNCNGFHCGPVANNEWYIYAFEAAPMVLYTYWLNIIHPGRFLPIEHVRYLDADGKTERMGPGWIDRRSKWKTYLDPFDIAGARNGWSDENKFWLTPDEWPVCEDGSFAQETASNVGKKSRLGKQKNPKARKTSSYVELQGAPSGAIS